MSIAIGSVHVWKDPDMIAIYLAYPDMNTDIKIHIFSQGNINLFKYFNSEKIIFHLNETIEKTFLLFCFADILVTSASSFSYTAALLNNNEIYYTKFWHPPLKNWNII